MAIEYKQIKSGLLWGLLTRDKNMLTGPLEVQTCIRGIRCSTEKIDLYKNGKLVLHHDFYWDGASGPTIDTENTMRASAVHDALYCLIKLGHIPRNYRWKADIMLYKIMREDGANPARAFCWIIAVEIFGRYHI